MDQQAAGPQGSRPRSCTEGCKRQAADLMASTGRTAPSAAAEAGTHHTLLPRGVRRHGQPAGSAAATPAAPPRLAAASSLKPVPVLRADQAAEPDAEHLSGIARLRRGDDRLRMERGILEKGIAIFAARHGEALLHRGPPHGLAGAGDVRRAAGLPIRPLLDEIRTAQAASGGRCSSPRVHAVLRAGGRRAGAGLSA